MSWHFSFIAKWAIFSILSFSSPTLLFLLSFSSSLFSFSSFWERKKKEKRLKEKQLWERERKRKKRKNFYSTLSTHSSSLFSFGEGKKKEKNDKAKNKLIYLLLLSTHSLFSRRGKRERKITLTLLFSTPFSPREGGEKGRNVTAYKIFFGRQKGPCFFITRSWFRLYFLFYLQGVRIKIFAPMRINGFAPKYSCDLVLGIIQYNSEKVKSLYFILPCYATFWVPFQLRQSVGSYPGYITHTLMQTNCLRVRQEHILHQWCFYLFKV